MCDAFGNFGRLVYDCPAINNPNESVIFPSVCCWSRASNQITIKLVLPLPVPRASAAGMRSSTIAWKISDCQRYGGWAGEPLELRIEFDIIYQMFRLPTAPNSHRRASQSRGNARWFSRPWKE